MADIIITPASSLMAFTSSLNYKQTITQEASGSLTLLGSGSTGRTDLFTVNGNNGTLFSVSDDLSDSLFSVNTIAGLPVIEAFANNTVVMGQYGQNVLVVTGSNVGIGVSNPSAKLQVTGSFGLNGADSNFPFFVSDPSTSSRYTLTNKGMGFNLSDDYAQLQLYGGNGGYIDFVNAAQDYNARIIYYGGSRLDLVYGTTLSITAGGNVGIGNNSPGEKLEVNGSIRLNDGNADGPQLKLASSGYSDWNLDNFSGNFRAYYGSTEYFRITSGGNVGIGTTSISYKLDVNGTTRVVGGILGQDSSNNTRYEFAPDLAYTLVGVGDVGDYKINSGAVSLTSMLRIKSTSTNGWLSSTKYFNGTVISEGLCAEVISTAGTLVFLDSNGEWGIADADVSAKSVTLLGIALNPTSNIGDTVDVLIDGIIALKSNHDQISVPAAPGAPLFVSTNAGNVTEVAPAVSGDIVRLVGHNIWSATSPANTAVIRFQPDATWIEL